MYYTYFSNGFFSEKEIGGVAFPLVPDEMWESFSLSPIALLIIKHISSTVREPIIASIAIVYSLHNYNIVDINR